MPRKIHALALLALAALTTGCISQRTVTVGGKPADVKLPKLGRQVGPDFWAAAQAIPGDDPIVIEEYSAVPYLHYRKRRVEVEQYRERATLATYRMVYAGIPEVFLPLYFRTSKSVYKEGHTEPTGKVARHYNPFYSNSHLKGFAGTEPRLMAGGMPLLVEVGKESGPAWLEREGTRVKSDGVYTTRTKAFVPLLAGKTPGLIAWSHYTTTTDAPDGTSTTFRGHGPFGGLFLAGEREETHPDRPRNLLRLIVGGILWTDIEKGERGAADYSSQRGLLWSGFGYGRENDEVWSKRQLRFCWLPITYGRDLRE